MGGILLLEALLAEYTRRGIDLDTHWFVQYSMPTQPYNFTKGSIFHLIEPDLDQDGLPKNLSTIPSSQLNCKYSCPSCTEDKLAQLCATPGLKQHFELLFFSAYIHD